MKINVEKKAEVEAALLVVNGTNTAFTITSHSVVQSVASDAAAILIEKGVPKNLWAGTKVIFVPSGPKSAAYRYSVITTKITLLRGTGGWFLIGIERVDSHRSRCENLTLNVSVAVRDAALAHAVSGLVVQ